MSAEVRPALNSTIRSIDLHHYKWAANELWKFCGSSGGQWLQAATALAYRREQGDEPDWWTIGARRRS
ncbi:MAG: hypothetical protein ABWZ99_17655 [Ilumatobacteraceae bacterium]